MAFIPRTSNRPRQLQPMPKRWAKAKPEFNYQGRKWRNMSQQHRINNPLCAHCQKQGLTVPATVTDHIKPISQGGDAWDINNFQSLCESCHNKKSRSEHKK